MSIFDEDVSQIVERNQLRYLTRESMGLSILNLIQMERCINRMVRKEYEDGEIIIPKDQLNSCLYFVTGKSQWSKDPPENQKNMRICGDAKIWEENPIYSFDSDLISCDSPCVVYLLDLNSIFESVDGIRDIELLTLENKKSNEFFTNSHKCEKNEDISKYSFVRNLGTGGYGSVILTIDDKGAKTALKIIPKKTIKTSSAIKMIKVIFLLKLE